MTATGDTEASRLREDLAAATAAARDAWRNSARLIRLLTVIGQPGTPERLVDETLIVLCEVFSCEIACLAQAVGDRLLVTHSCGLPEGDPAFVEGWSVGAGAERAMSTGRVTVSEADVPPALRRFGIRSAALVPLAAGSDVSDLLMLYRGGDRFADGDLPVLDLVAYRLRQAVAERERHVVMERLVRFGHRLAVHLDPGTLFQEAVELLAELTGAERTWAVTVDGAVANLRAFAGGRPDGGWPRPAERLVGWAQTAQGLAYRSGTGPQPLLAVPVVRDGTPVAVLYAARTRPRPFSRETAETSVLFANYLGAALVNAELYRALGHSETSLRLITDTISDMVSVVDAGHTLTYASPSHLREIGHEPGDLLGRRIVDLVHPTDRARLRAALDGAPGTGAAKVEYRLRADGRWVWVESALRPASTTAGTVVLSSRVIDERKRLEEELWWRATHDPLTGLANRVLVGQRLEEALAGLPARPVGLLFCDLDKFKEVNDALGHEIGDELLVGVAGRLHACIRPDDLLARLGGDEFVIVLPGIGDVGEVAEVGQRLLRALAEPFVLGGERISVSLSVGAALGVPGRATARALLRRADEAMYTAKQRGRGLVEVADDPERRGRLDLRHELTHALDRQQLTVEYQPIVTLEGGRLRLFSAVLGWVHPERGRIPPEVFGPLADETEVGVRMRHWLLETVGRQLAVWRGLPAGRDLAVCVEVSPAQLGHLTAAADMLRTMKEAGVEPGNFWFALSGHDVVGESAACTIAALRAAGARFALDDFTMSAVDVSRLGQLPVERIQIDKSVVVGLAGREVDAGIVSAVLVIADSLGLDVVAKGVHSPRLRDTLVALGCELGQGPLFGPPVPAGAATELLHDRSRAATRAGHHGGGTVEREAHVAE